MNIIVLILGIIIGSFLNVCIYRIPKGESIIFHILIVKMWCKYKNI